MKLRNLTLSTKLLFGFFTIAIVSTVISIIDLQTASTTNNTITALIQNRMPSVQYLVMMKEGITAVKAAQRTITIPTLIPEDRKRQYKRFDEAFERINKAIDEYQKIQKDNFENENWKIFLEGYRNWESLHQKFVTKSKEIDVAYQNNDPKVNEYLYELMKITMFELKDPFFQIESQLDKLTEHNINLSHEESNEAFSEMYTTKVITIILTIFSFSLAIVLGLWISKNVIKKPISQLILVFNNIMKGDFRNQIEIKNNDEIGQISNLVNKLISHRKEEISDLIKRSDIILNSSDRLLNISKQSDETSEKLKEQTSIAASSSEEVSANISTVSSAAEEMSSSVKEIAKNTSSASNISNEAAQKASIASEVMDRLGKSSLEIGNIVKVINSIAEQTNLLALNATIEAARAGESGKGFAVVANEVKELAKGAAKATEDITNRIKTIQDESNSAINVIKDIINSITQVNDIANSIASAVEEQTVTTAEITRNLSEASKGASMVAETNIVISKTANDYRIIAKQIKDDADNLSDIASSLKEHLISSYKF